MLENNLIILIGNLPWKWSTDYPFQTASALSKNNYVLFYNLQESFSIKEYFKKKQLPQIWQKYSQNFYIYTPIQFFPFRRFSFVSRINNSLNIYIVQFIAFALYWIFNYSNKILWVFDPQFYDEVYSHFHNFYILYDCLDYFPGSSLRKRKSDFIREQQLKLFKSADKVVVNSHILKFLYKKFRNNIEIVPQGFRFNTFIKRKGPKLENKNIKKPIIGYIGGINFRLDYDLLISLVSKCPEYNFVLAGPIQRDNEFFSTHCLSKFNKLITYTNVSYLGERSKEDIPALIETFSIGLIPYNSRLEFNRYCYPMKVFEYFYLGKPIMSSTIEELKKFPKYIFMNDSPEGWKKIIKKLLIKPWPIQYKRRQRLLAEENTWEKKIESINI
jgi:hypothetical protein